VRAEPDVRNDVKVERERRVESEARALGDTWVRRCAPTESTVGVYGWHDDLTQTGAAIGEDPLHVPRVGGSAAAPREPVEAIADFWRYPQERDVKLVTEPNLEPRSRVERIPVAGRRTERNDSLSIDADLWPSIRWTRGEDDGDNGGERIERGRVATALRERAD
jgi:hypothetical protein